MALLMTNKINKQNTTNISIISCLLQFDSFLFMGKMSSYYNKYCTLVSLWYYNAWDKNTHLKDNNIIIMQYLHSVGHATSKYKLRWCDDSCCCCRAQRH